MNIYMLSGPGNGEDIDGPNATDNTHVLVRASTLERATELADSCTTWLPKQCGEEGCPVSGLMDAASLVATTDDPHEQEAILAGPWYERSYALLRSADTWTRDFDTGDWELFDHHKVNLSTEHAGAGLGFGVLRHSPRKPGE